MSAMMKAAMDHGTSTPPLNISEEDLRHGLNIMKFGDRGI